MRRCLARSYPSRPTRTRACTELAADAIPVCEPPSRPEYGHHADDERVSGAADCDLANTYRDTCGVVDTLIDALDSLEELGWADQIVRLQDALTQAVVELGGRYFRYQLVTSSSLAVPLVAPAVLANEPASWTDCYLSNNYAADDPVLARAVESRRLFRWTDVGVRSPTHLDFFKDASQFGMIDAITVPIHVGGDLAALSVVPTNPQEPFHRRDVLYFLAHYVFTRTRQPLIELMLATSSRRRTMLSPRQTQVLALTAKGKVTAEISLALGIARTSVEFHIEGAKQRLHVANRTHAVAKAIALGMIPAY